MVFLLFMFIRQQFKVVNGKRKAYWALVESVRTDRGPRQRVVSWLGSLDEAGRLGLLEAAKGQSSETDRENAWRQLALFEYEDQAIEPRWVHVNAKAVRVENKKHFGGPWLAMQLLQRLRLDDFFKKHQELGREQVPWSLVSMTLVIARLLDPSSELFISEQWYPKTALPELLGVPAERVDDNRLYRALDVSAHHRRGVAGRRGCESSCRFAGQLTGSC